MTSLLHTTNSEEMPQEWNWAARLHPASAGVSAEEGRGCKDSRAEWGADREHLLLQASPRMERSNRCRYTLHLHARSKQEQEGTCLTQGLELRSEPQRKQIVFSTECI